MTRRDREQGASGLQMAILALPLLMLIGLGIGFYRMGKAEVTIQAVAADAARAASIQRDAGAAQAAAAEAATQSLDQQGLRCASVSTAVDTSQFGTPAGVPAQVSATVTCTVRADKIVPGLPAGSRTFSSRAVSAIDTFRQRGS